MDSKNFPEADVLSVIKIGCFTILLGSVVVALLTLLYFYTQDLFFPLYDPTLNANVLIIVPCISGAFINALPYVFASYIVNLYELGKKGILIIGAVAMVFSISLGSYYGFEADYQEIKSIKDLGLALVLCIAFYFPYYFSFVAYYSLVKGLRDRY